MDSDKIEVGDRIVLGRHVDATGNTYFWTSDMDKYVGMACTVKQILEDTKYGKYVVPEEYSGCWILRHCTKFSFPAPTAEHATVKEEIDEDPLTRYMRERLQKLNQEAKASGILFHVKIKEQ